MAERDIVEQLQKCSDLVSSNPNLPGAIKRLLDQALALAEEVHAPEKSVKDSSPEVSLLKMVLQISGATRLLNLRDAPEAATAALSDMLPADGVLVLRGDAVQVKNNMKSEQGSAKEILDMLASESKEFNVIILDDGSETLIEDFEIVLKRHLLALNGTLLVMFAGDTSSVAFSAHITGDERLEQVNLPISGKEVMIIRRRSSLLEKETTAILDDVCTGVQRRNILQRFRLDGKVALVTGSGQGIGRGYAHALGEAGAKVAVVDIFEERAKHVCHELLEKGIDAMWLQTDVTKEDQVKLMVESVVDRWGALHIAFNNAGIVRSLSAEDHTVEDWNAVMDVNINSVFMCCKAEYAIMAKQGYGKIVNTASMCSVIVLRPQKQVSYNVSKIAVLGLTRTLAVEWAEKGIRVNCISPGYVKTPMNSSDHLKPLFERWVSEIPAGRMQEVTDLQGVAIYLASEASDYTTGENVVVDGGKCTL
ncbi:2-dehydro-3-deoxy-D-gluconate 5-dehydrogenase-like [Lineus longissimus]|uniref:2-dehydro-3-deoxy-D-gluconate 5-dehydrogenase-like n=1 Tax=Lineus longissimus TaxID=88925 RepID=UPI002B4D7818